MGEPHTTTQNKNEKNIVVPWVSQPRAQDVNSWARERRKGGKGRPPEFSEALGICFKLSKTPAELTGWWFQPTPFKKYEFVNWDE